MNMDEKKPVFLMFIKFYFLKISLKIWNVSKTWMLGASKTTTRFCGLEKNMFFQ